MAMLCSQCGKAIEQDDIQFCKHCGAPVQQQSPEPQSLMYADQPSSSPKQPDTKSSEQDPSGQDKSVRAQVVKQANQKLPLREQIARQPGQKTQHPSAVRAQVVKQPGIGKSGERPALKEQTARIEPRQSRPRLSSEQTSTSEFAEQDDAGESNMKRPSPPVSSAIPQTPKVPGENDDGDQETDHTRRAVHSKKPGVPPEAQQDQKPDSVERPAPLTHVSVSEHSGRSSEQEKNMPSELPKTETPVAHSAPVPADQMDLPSTPPLSEHHDSAEEEPIEDRPTQLMEYKEPERSMDDIPTSRLSHDKQDIDRCDTVHVGTAKAQPYLSADNQQQRRVAASGAQADSIPVMRRDGVGQPHAALLGVNVSPRLAKGRLSPALMAVLLAALVLVGVGIWIVTAQPFTVAAVTQPQLSFSNNDLHISLLYPNGWQYKVDTSRSTVQFHDSSNTALVTIATTSANGQDIAPYLRAQAGHIGMANLKALPSLSFAGATWQQVQGTVQQSGANYTSTILATVSGNRMVTITQQAPQTTYNEEEDVIFSPIRASLKLS